MPRQEPVVTICEGLALMTELLSELLAFRLVVAASAVDVIHYLLAHPHGPCLSGRSGHDDDASLAEVCSHDGVPLVPRRLSGPEVDSPILLNAEVVGDLS